MTMKKLINILFIGLLMVTFSCEEEEFDLGLAPTAADAVFTFEADAQGENYIKLTNTSDAFLKVWDFGNGSSMKGDDVIAYYPFAGTYDVTLTVYTKGGAASSTATVTIANTDPEICNVEFLQLLTGGCSATEGKTWVIDAERSGHFGIGPIGSAGPDWYQATANEKVGGGMYDDEFTFFLNESKFVQQTNGDVYINTAQGSNFPGATDSPVGDLIAPFTSPGDINYSITEDEGGNKFINLTNNAFIGYNTGVSTYQIMSITEDEMFIRFLDAAGPDFAWYHRLIRKGFTPPPPESATLPFNFESASVPFTGFGGSSYALVDNPDASGINTTAKVGQLNKGSETWAGIVVELENNIDFSVNNAFKLKVLSPKTGVAKLKIENKTDSNTALEVDVNITKANEWEELVFDFSGAASDTYGKIALFLDFGTAGENTFYFDDLTQSQTVASTLSIDFEDGTPAFTPFGNSSATIVDNQDVSAGNGSAKVMEFVKTTGSETWAGASTDIAYFLNFSAKSSIKLKVWSPRAGITVKFKIENQDDPNTNIEKDLTTTLTNQWEELTYDFSGTAADTYNRVVVFMDFGAQEDATYYFDEIVQE